MLHHTRYDDVEHLHSELEHERRYKETIEWSNAELERSINELSVYLQELEANSRSADDNEWKVRFESQTALNKQLQDQKDFLEAELIEARRRLNTGTYPEAMNFNLDSLNEPELLRLVKHLERMRNDFYSTLRDTEWKLDKESKEFHHFDEMRRVYRADLKHANHLVERMRLGVNYDPELASVYPGGYYNKYSDHSPSSSYKPGGDPYGDRDRDRHGAGGGGGGGVGKKSQKKGGSSSNGGGKSAKAGQESPTRGKSPTRSKSPVRNKSPTRSKSRMEKKSKKKEPPPPAAEEPAPKPNRGSRKGSIVVKESEPEAGNVTDASAAEQDAREKTSITSSTGDTFTISVSKEDSDAKKDNED